jgi:oligopeptide transport system substrate-binding protein
LVAALAGFSFASRHAASFCAPVSTPRSLLSFILLAAALTVAGCGKPAATEAVTQAGRPLKIWHVGNGAEVQDLDPQCITGIPEHKVVAALFEGLLTENPQDLHPEPGLADRWEISPDGLVYTFHLRPNARWSDGAPITSEDFLLSYKRMLSPALGAEYSYLLWCVVGAEDYNRGTLTNFAQVGFRAPDPHTLQFTLRNPMPFLLRIIASHYAWSPVPIKVIERFGGLDRKSTKWTQPGNLVASGPFRLMSWLPNQKIVVERNPLYWDAATVKLDEIHFYATDDIPTEERMFRTGQLQKTNELPNAKIDNYRKEYPESLRIEPYLGVYFYRFNVTRPPLNDKRVRQALALAIDRESIVKNVARGNQTPAYAVSYPGTAGYSPRARLEGDLAKARRLLAEAGFPEGKGWPHVELMYNTSENHRAIAEAIQQMWQQNLGITVQLANQEWKVYLDAQDHLDYWMQRSGWIADYLDPHVFLEIWTTGNGNNDTGWSNAEYDRLYQLALAAPDEKSRYEIYQQMDAILVDELPVLPIYNYTRVYALSPRVKGWYPSLLDNHPYKYIDLAD